MCSVGKQITKKKSQKKVIIIRERQSTLEIFKRSFTRTGANVWNLIPFDRRNRLLNAFFREKFEDFYSILFWIRATMLKSTIKLFQRKHALRALQNRCEVLIISIGNSMICSGIWHKYLEWYFKIVIRNFTSRQASEIWDNFEISQVVFMPNIRYKSCYYLFILLPTKGL